MWVSNQVIDVCDSTNLLARQLGDQGAPHGTWISARRQNAGRGRQGREWVSQEGNLFLSMVLRPVEKSIWTWIPLAAAIGTVNALRLQWSDLDVQIKWPNDLWIDGKKLGGILCEGIGGSGPSYIVMGLGLNCVTSPHGLDQQTVSLSQALGQNINAHQIRESVVTQILQEIERLENSGFAPLIRTYEKHAAFGAGAEITWSEGRGLVAGLGPSGELKVIDDRGKEQRLFAEEIRAVRKLVE